jgi:hypothetical protein
MSSVEGDKADDSHRAGDSKIDPPAVRRIPSLILWDETEESHAEEPLDNISISNNNMTWNRHTETNVPGRKIRDNAATSRVRSFPSLRLSWRSPLASLNCCALTMLYA